MDVNDKIKKLMVEHDWTEYKLAKESGLSQSTIANIFKRNTVPSIITLEAICDGLGITLAQFFAEDEFVSLNEEQKMFFDKWINLTKEQKDLIYKLIEQMK